MRRFVAALAALPLLGLAACSGGGGGAASTGPATSAPGGSVAVTSPAGPGGDSWDCPAGVVAAVQQSETAQDQDGSTTTVTAGTQADLEPASLASLADGGCVLIIDTHDAGGADEPGKYEILEGTTTDAVKAALQSAGVTGIVLPGATAAEVNSFFPSGTVVVVIEDQDS